MSGIQSFDTSLILAPHVIYEAPAGGVADYKFEMAVYTDSVFSAWREALDGETSTEFEHYMSQLYSDVTLAISARGGAYDDAGYVPS